jgi:hypothetical protein
VPITLPQSVKKLLQDKAYGHVVTFNAQGHPQLTMVWLDVDGDEVLFNIAIRPSRSAELGAEGA